MAAGVLRRRGPATLLRGHAAGWLRRSSGTGTRTGFDPAVEADAERARITAAEQARPVPRTDSTAVLRGKRLVYAKHGDPTEVLGWEDYETAFEIPEGDEVMVRMLAAPINPADINQIEGVYPIKPALPAVGGNEGVGEVVKVKDGIETLEPLDRVVPYSAGLGTWRSIFTCKADDLIKVSPYMPVELSGTLSVNPCTAYRMLKDFVALEEGDVVLQNGANSAVGASAIQIAKAMGLRTVNIVRSRDDPEKDAELKIQLEAFGADLVLFDNELSGKSASAILGDLPKPKLALNCVGGRSSLTLAKLLAPKGALVTYGGMSKQPVMIPTGKLIFNDVTYHGFWMTRWNEEADRADREAMLAELTTMVMDGKLLLPHRTWGMHKALEAVEAAVSPMKKGKQIIMFT